MKKIITARIDDQVGYQIEYLKQHLGIQSTTRILTEAIGSFYNDIKQEERQKTPFELLEELNLIGCFEGEKTLSKNYKKILSQSLAKKHTPKAKKNDKK